MYNKTVVVGNLARDPEQKTFGEHTVTKLVVACKDAYNQDKTSFFDVDVWGKAGENCAKYLEKGRQVLIDGRLVQESWENNEGQKRYKVFIKADNVQFLGKKADGNAKESPPKETSESNDNGFDEDVPF